MTVMTAGPERNAMPFLHGTEAGEVLRVLASGYYTHGPETERFENELATFLGVPDVVAVASGTAALHVALLAAGIGPGDEVIVPSFTFCATIQAIVACGANPRFIDIDLRTLCVEPDDVLRAVTPATRAVMPVLYGGRAVDLTGIAGDLSDKGIVNIDDAAHAFGSLQGDHLVGSTGTLTCFSFDPIKNITCGEGGALVPRTPEEAEQARSIRELGIAQSREQRSHAASYTVEGFGVRAHMPALNAAIGRAQLARFQKNADRRRRAWRAYQTAISRIPGITLVDVDIEHSVPFNCVIRIPGERDHVFAKLRSRGIGVGVHYPPNHLQPAFSAWHRPLPRTEQAGREVLSLPFHPALTDSDIEHVATALERVL